MQKRFTSFLPLTIFAKNLILDFWQGSEYTTAGKLYLYFYCTKNTQCIFNVLIIVYIQYRSSCPEVFCKKGALKNFAKFKRKSCRFQANSYIKKDTPTQVFHYELCEIFKNTFFTEHLRATASVLNKNCKIHWKTK